MGNNTMCKTVGIVNICLGCLIERFEPLTNVHYVPDLRKSVLSLGALKAQGCKFSGADGGIEVTKDSMMILKGERNANLYKMT